MQKGENGMKQTLGQQTEDRLMKYILDKPVKIGEKIPNEYELTELFGVGRSTVREAVKGLVTRGVLEVRRGDGTYVISTSYMENDVLGFGNVEDRYRLALDLFDVRLMIEPEIVTWACRKATFDNGGICGVCKWSKHPEEVEFVLSVLERLAERYGERKGLWGIEVINEPVTENMWETMKVPEREPSVSDGCRGKGLRADNGRISELYQRTFSERYSGNGRIFPGDLRRMVPVQFSGLWMGYQRRTVRIEWSGRGSGKFRK